MNDMNDITHEMHEMKNGSAVEQARILGMTRAAIGAALFLAPGLTTRMWLGADAKSRGAKLVSRALGMREIAIGVGTVIALQKDAPVRGWLEAGVLVDTSDFLTTLIARRTVPAFGRVAVSLGAAAGAATGLKLARELG